jgi:hypothetical protein
MSEKQPAFGLASIVFAVGAIIISVIGLTLPVERPPGDYFGFSEIGRLMSVAEAAGACALVALVAAIIALIRREPKRALAIFGLIGPIGIIGFWFVVFNHG